MATVNKDFRIKQGLNVESGSITTPLTGSATGVVLASTAGVLSRVDTLANSYLTNSAITFGSTSQALGSTITNIAGVTINSTTIPTSKTLVVTTDIGTSVQAYDEDLASIAALTGTSGFLKTNGTGTWSVDTATYLTSMTAATPTVAGVVYGLTGGSNTALGINALTDNTGSNNTAIGTWALKVNTTGYVNTAVGGLSLSSNTTGTGNVGLGASSLSTNTTGSSNTAIGTSTLFKNVDGSTNTAIGDNALYENIDGSYNTAVGMNALRNGTAGEANTAIGQGAGFAANGTGNVFIGRLAGSAYTGSNKLYIANNSTTTLILGDFSAKTLIVDGALTADSFKTPSGTSSQFLKANGSIDSSTYLTTAVTSVGLSLPNIFTVSNSPVTTTGSLTATLASQTANTVFAAPNGSNGTPTFRALAKADIPGVNNSLVLKADSGTTEGTDLYTFDGSAAKTLNLIGGTNITISKTAGAWTITGAATGVTSLSFGSTGLTPNTGTTGAITVAGTLVAANGGTGQSSYAIGDILYASGSTALSKLAAGTSSQVLIGGTTPSWGAVALGSMVSGTLPVANGGTGTTNGSITGTGALTYTAGGTNTNINLVPNGTGTVDVASKRITNVATPTSDYDAANKLYVDGLASGVNAHDASKYATTGALGTTGNLVGGTITTTYANGTDGVGATLTIATSSNWTSITIDGQSLSVNDRVLIKNQAADLQNGIYTVTSVGAVGNTTSFVFTRALDNDQTPELGQGDLTFVISGTSNGGQAWVQTATVTSVGSSSITWTQFSGVSDITAGAGLVRNGNTIDVATASSSRIVVNSDNIDLATVSQSNTSGSAGINFAQSVTVDSYGRVTGVASADVRTATSSAAGIAYFPTTQFTLTGASVAISSLAGSVINSGVVGATYGGTGINNGSNTITLGGNINTAGAFTTSGAFGLTLTTTALTNVTLPTTGTLATLAGAESLTNKKLGSLTTNGLVTTSGGDGTLSVTTMGTGIATFLSTPTSANLASALTDESGTGSLVFSASPALTGTVTFNAAAGVVTASGSTTGTTALTLSSVFAAATYDGAEFTVKIKNGVNLEIIRVLVITNGTDFYVTQYGDVQSNTALATIDFSITAGNVNLVITPVAGATGTTSVKAIGHVLAA